MAEEVEEEPKKSNLLKIIIFVVGGFLLIAVGLGIGYFLFGGEPEPDPSADVDVVQGQVRLECGSGARALFEPGEEPER